MARYGDDMPAISGWKRGLEHPFGGRATSTERDRL
jgi:hypothetical protein